MYELQNLKLHKMHTYKALNLFESKYVFFSLTGLRLIFHIQYKKPGGNN